MAVGGGHCCVPRDAEEARQSKADREVIPPDYLGVRHAAGLDAILQGPRPEGLVDQEGVHPVPGRVERGGHVIDAACCGPPEAAGLPAHAEVLCCQVGVTFHVDVTVASDDHQLPPTEAARLGIHLYVGAESCPLRPWGAACLRSKDVDEGKSPLSVRTSRAAAFLGMISVKLSTSCSGTYLLLTAVRGSPPLEVEWGPVSASRLLKHEVYPLS